jgi:hypothetical protein
MTAVKKNLPAKIGANSRLTTATQSVSGSSETTNGFALCMAASNAKPISSGSSTKYTPTSQVSDPSSTSKTPTPVGSGNKVSQASANACAVILSFRVVKAVKVVI